MFFWFIFFVVFFGLAGSLTLIIYFIGEGIKKQTNKDIKKGEVYRFFAPVPRPGTFSFIALEGNVTGMIENVSSWKIKNFPDIGRCFTIGNREDISPLQGFLENQLGVVWIGPFATIRVFTEWKWSEFKQVETEEEGVKVPKFVVASRKENVSDFFFQFSYPVIVEDAEIRDNIRVKIVAVLTVLHLHPMRAFFLNKDPVALFAAMVQSAFRTYVIDKTFDEVKSIKASNSETTEDRETFWNVLERLNGIQMDKTTGAPDYAREQIDPLGLFGKLGYYVARAEVVQVETVGETAEALEAAKLAELRGEAEVVKARKAGEAAVVRATAEAESLNKKREARRQYVEETIVKPTGGPGEHVADVLVSENFSSEKSPVQTLIMEKTEKKRTLLSLPTTGGKGLKEP